MQQSLTTAAPLSSRLSSDHDDDLDSLHSYGSGVSAYSTASQCDHAHFARNGTTFSARRMRYVVHCSPHSNAGDDYLTPTQRANRTIRRLKVSDQLTNILQGFLFIYFYCIKNESVTLPVWKFNGILIMFINLYLYSIISIINSVSNSQHSIMIFILIVKYLVIYCVTVNFLFCTWHMVGIRHL